MSDIPLHDLSPISFGKYKDRPLQDVPASYLLWLWDNDEGGLWFQGSSPLRDYIVANFAHLETKATDFIVSHHPDKHR